VVRQVSRGIGTTTGVIKPESESCTLIMALDRTGSELRFRSKNKGTAARLITGRLFLFP